MPGYTPNSNIPYPLGTDPIRGTTADNIRVDMQQLAEGADAGDVATKAAAVEQTKTELQPRFALVEELAAAPGTHIENIIPDPAPLDVPSTWTAGNATLQQATIWGRAIATGGAGVSVRPNLGTGAEMYEPVSTGDPVGATIIIRAMNSQTITANMHVRGWSWDGASFTFVSNIASSGQKDIAPDVAVTFTASGTVPSGVTHVDMYFTFTRQGETYPIASDFVYFRRAALFVGNVPSPITYSDGSSEYSYWTGVPGASTSISMKPRSSGGGGAEAHAALLDDFTQRRGGVKHIGPRTSISFRIDHGLANFDAKMRAKLESLGFKYALALGSRDWGASENAGITPTIVNNWVVGGFAEIWSHSIGHADADTPAKIRDYIANSRKELEADIPAAKVDGYMPPGAGGTRYMGFGPSDTPQKFFETLAGQMILQTYAVTGGNMDVYRVQDGAPRIGQSYFNMDTFDTAGVMVRVQNAINDGRGIQLMIHPSLIDTAGHITTAQLHAVFDQIKALQDAGDVVVMSAYDQLLADSTGVPGEPGPAGAGVPAGGTALQMIRKNLAGTTTEWVTPTKSIVGLNNVDNTSDMNKPVSTMQKLALDEKLDAAKLPNEVDGVNKNLIEDPASLTAGALSAAIGETTDPDKPLGVLLMQTYAQEDGRVNATDKRLGTPGTRAALINALDAAESAGRGTVVSFPSGVYEVGEGLSLAGRSALIQGAGGFVRYGSMQSGTVFKASTQNGPVLDFKGWIQPDQFRGRVRHGDFVVQGSGIADPTKKNTGIEIDYIGSTLMHDIAITDTGGAGFLGADLPGYGQYLSDFERITVTTPVGAFTNDVPYFELSESNCNRFRGCGLRSVTIPPMGSPAGDVGASGAVIVRSPEGGSFSSAKSLYDAWWFENLHVPNGGTLIHVESRLNVFADLQFIDCYKEPGATGTSHIRFANAPGVLQGGNELRGLVPGRDPDYPDTDPAKLHSIDYGVDMLQSYNRVVGVKGRDGHNIRMGNNINAFIDLGGSSFATPTPAVDYTGAKNPNTVVLDGSSSVRTQEGWESVSTKAVIQPLANSTSSITATSEHHTIVTSGAAIVVTMPDPTTVKVGREWVIKNSVGGCTIVSAGPSKTIDGASSKTLANWAAVRLVSNGSSWLTT